MTGDSDIFPTTFPEPWTPESYVHGHHQYVRELRLDLAKVVIDLVSDQKATQVKYLHIYCDALSYDRSLNGDAAVIDLGPVRGRLKYIHIYATSFLTKVPNLRKLRFIGSPDVQIQLVCEVVPDRLLILGANSEQNPSAEGCEIFPGPVTCDGGLWGSCPHAHHSFGVADVGLSLVSGDPKLSMKTLTLVPTAEVVGASIDDMKAVGAAARHIDNLPKLLHWLFVAASTDLMKSSLDEQLIATRLQYIVRCTKGSISKIDMAIDAQTLLGTFDFPREVRQRMQASPSGQRFYIEPLSLKENLTYLEKQLEVAMKVDTDLKQSQFQTQAIELMRQGFSKIVGEMGESTKSFADLDSLNSRAIFDLFDWADKARDLQTAKIEADRGQEQLQRGIAEFQAQQNAEATQDAMKAGIELIIGIATAVSTFRASSPLTVSKAGKMVKGENAEDGSLEKLWNATKKLAEVGAQVFPPLKAVYETQTLFDTFGKTAAQTTENSNSALQKALTDTGNSITTQTATQQNLNAVNFTGLVAGWQSFQVEVDSFFSILRDSYGMGKVDGMENYYKSLKKQVIQGKTMLQAMKNAQESSQAYYRQIAENKSRDKRAKELKATADKLATKEEGEAFRSELIYGYQRRLASFRRTLYLQLRRCILAYMYEFNQRALPQDYLNDSSATFALRADHTIEEYGRIREHLLREVMDARGTQVNLQNAPGNVVYGTVENKADRIMKAFDDNWKEIMVLTKRIPFNIPLQPPLAIETSRRVRVTKLGAEFEGLDITTSGSDTKPYIRYSICLGPEMADVAMTGSPPTFAYFYYNGRAIDHVAGQPWQDSTWVDDGQKFLQPALFCSGEIVFKRADVDEKLLGAIKGVKLMFQVQSV